MAEFGLRRYFILSRRPCCNAKEMAEQNSKCRKTEFKVDLIKKLPSLPHNNYHFTPLRKSFLEKQTCIFLL